MAAIFGSFRNSHFSRPENAAWAEPRFFFDVAACISTSLIRNNPPVGSYSRSMPRGPYGDPRGVGVLDERGTPVVAGPARKGMHGGNVGFDP